MWCLALYLPFIIGDKIPEEDEMWHLFLKREIMAMCFSPAISKDQLAYFQILIEGHHKKFCRIYSACSIIPKMHYMIHMPSVMLKWVPVSLILILCIYTRGSSQCIDWTKVDSDSVVTFNTNIYSIMLLSTLTVYLIFPSLCHYEG